MIKLLPLAAVVLQVAIAQATCGADFMPHRFQYAGLDKDAHACVTPIFIRTKVGKIDLPLYAEWSYPATTPKSVLGQGWFCPLLDACVIQMNQRTWRVFQPDGYWLDLNVITDSNLATNGIHLRSGAGFWAILQNKKLTLSSACGPSYSFVDGRISRMTFAGHTLVWSRDDQSRVVKIDADGARAYTFSYHDVGLLNRITAKDTVSFSCVEAKDSQTTTWSGVTSGSLRFSLAEPACDYRHGDDHLAIRIDTATRCVTSVNEFTYQTSPINEVGDLKIVQTEAGKLTSSFAYDSMAKTLETEDKFIYNLVGTASNKPSRSITKYKGFLLQDKQSLIDETDRRIAFKYPYGVQRLDAPNKSVFNLPALANERRRLYDRIQPAFIAHDLNFACHLINTLANLDALPCVPTDLKSSYRAELKRLLDSHRTTWSVQESQVITAIFSEYELSLTKKNTPSS